MNEPKVGTHRVIFEVEDEAVFYVGTTCLVELGGCHVGCPVLDCDWAHDEEACHHCEGSCACDCPFEDDPALHPEHKVRVWSPDEVSHRHECWCSEALAHRDLGFCPHTFIDTGACWLLPWVADGDHDWLDTDLHALGWPTPDGRWTMDYATIDGEHDEWWAPANPIKITLTRVED